MAGLSNRATGYLVTMLGVLAISPDGLLTRFIQADSFTITFWRGLFYGLAVTTFVMLRYRSRYFVMLGQFGLTDYAIMFFYGIGNLLFIYSITHTSVANTLFMLSTTPIWAAVIGWVFLRERLAKRTWFAIAAVVVGILVITQGSAAEQHAWRGDIAGLLGAGVLAAQFTLIRSAGSRDALPALGLGGIFAALFLSPFISPAETTNSDLFYLILMGAVMLPVANALMYLGPRYIPAPEVGLMMLLETVLGPIWVWLALGENPGVWSIAGGAIVLVALVVNTVLGLREENKPPTRNIARMPGLQAVIQRRATHRGGNRSNQA